MTVDRSPAAPPMPASAALSRLPAFFALEGKRAVVAGGTPAAAWKAELLSAAGARVDVFAADTERGHAARSPTLRRAGRSRSISATGQLSDFAGAAIAVADCADDARGRGVRRGRARGGRAGQCHRPAGVLRFHVRRHRQSFAAGHRHFDRRRVAGVRPGDPRQDRSADPERFCPLGRSRARSGGRACRRWRCRFAAAAASGKNSPRARSRRPIARRADADLDALLMPSATPAGGFGHSRRRRSRRSGIADAARRARAAIRRRDPVRRSGFARHSRFRAPRGEENAGRQDRQ